MEVIILGNNNDDKGSQLEKLTASILKKLGYENIITNEVGSGGNEIDVMAEFNQPGIGNVTRRIVVCECKAYKTAVSTNDWLKFLGKIFTYELERNSIDGCFIALNGANGNVKGQYRALRVKRNDIHLISGEDLFRILTELYGLVNIEAIQSTISQKTKRSILATSVCYYREKFYWLITFNDLCFTLLHNDGSILGNDDSSFMRELVLKNLDLSEFIDLGKEEEYRQRYLFIEKYIISIFLLLGEKMTSTKILDHCNSKYGDFPINNFKEYEVTTALNSLMKKGVVSLSRQMYRLKVLTKVCSKEDLIIMLRLFFEEFVVILALDSKNYDGLINEELLCTICSIQGGISLPEEKKQDWLNLLRWSPSALGWSLIPDPMLVGHRKTGIIITKEIEFSDCIYFSQKLSTLLSKDFVDPALANYFFQSRGIVELETQQSLKIKSKENLISQIEFNERIQLAQFKDEEHDMIISVRLLTSVPEPWWKIR